MFFKILAVWKHDDYVMTIWYLILSQYLDSEFEIFKILNFKFQISGNAKMESLGGGVSFLSDQGSLDERAKALSAFRWTC